MENGKILNTSSQDSIQQELDKLNAILSERLTFDPLNVDDATLWDIVSKRENAKLHNYHCLIVRFGEPYEVEARHNYSAHRRIPISYANKRGSKNINDFSFGITTPDNTKRYNIIYNPHQMWDNQWILNGKNPENILSNQSFFLISSYNGVNKYGTRKSVWRMVELEDKIETNCRIIREYTLISQLWAYNSILSSPEYYGISNIYPSLEEHLKSLIGLKSNLLKIRTDAFLYKTDKRDDEDWRNQDDGSYEKDLQDELDYIRQNGGDWIDD